jgi:hypothetical protein
MIGDGVMGFVVGVIAAVLAHGLFAVWQDYQDQRVQEMIDRMHADVIDRIAEATKKESA